MTTMVYPSEKKIEKSSESERKEAYEKKSLEHEQSKDKQDIFHDNNQKGCG